MESVHTERLRLGNGVYSLAEVSRYTGLSPSRVRSWFKTAPSTRRAPVFSSDFPEVDNDLAVSFLDMIDVYVAGQFRNRGVSLSAVRESYEILKRDLSTDHPFCHEALYTDGSRIFVGLANIVGDETLSEAVTRQYFITGFIEQYLSKVDYSASTHLATRWRIGKGVVIDPAINFGKPVVENTNVSTWVLARSFQANHGDADLVAELYAVRKSDVLNAVAFSRKYEPLSAA